MSKGINKVILIGNLGTDPEVRFMPNGGAVANLTLATSEAWNDKATGEKKEQTEWHRLVIYQRLAEVAGEYLRKGSKIYVEGRLRTRKWQDQQGVERYTTEIIVSELQMLDGKPADAPAQQPQQRPQTTQQGKRPPPPGYQGTIPGNSPQGGFQPGRGNFSQQPQGGFNQYGGPQPPFPEDDDIPF